MLNLQLISVTVSKLRPTHMSHSHCIALFNTIQFNGDLQRYSQLLS